MTSWRLDCWRKHADDTHLVTVRDSIEQLEAAPNQALTTISGFIEEVELRLAVQKTEAVLFTTRRKYKKLSFELSGVKVEVLPDIIKYLDIWFDKKLSFRENLRQAAQKADWVMGRLNILLSNVGEPLEKKRRLLANVAMYVALYGARVCASAEAITYRRVEMEQVQRKLKLIRISGYRIISFPAVPLAGIFPLKIEIAEIAESYKATKSARNLWERRQGKNLAQQRAMMIWKKMLEEISKGKWMRELIRDFDARINGRHEQLTFHVTQLHCGHDAFQGYLHRMGIKPNPMCIYVDNAGHTSFKCGAWEQ